MSDNDKKPEQPSPDDRLAELHAMAQELQTNAIDNSIRNRMAALLSGSNFTGDTLHAISLDFGYPDELTFTHFWNMYRRFGIAKTVVELPVETGWRTPPTVETKNADFTRDLDKLIDRINFWVRLKGLDTRQRVGRYAGMFMRVRDNMDPKEPLVGKLNGEAALMDMIPLYESQLEVITSDLDPKSETFGQPIILQYRQSAVGSRNEKANNTISIHASRIVFAAEGADNGWIQGIPALEPVYNSLMDLRKIIGGGGEGFYKNAAQSTFFSLKDGASATGNETKLDKFNEQYDDFVRNRSRRGFWGPGMDAKTLESHLIGSKEFFDAALADVAAGMTPPTPATIVIGQQTGRLASNEDSRHFLSGVQSRRLNFQTEMTRNVIDWLMKFGILAFAEYEVVWDDLLARSDEEKLTNSKTMAETNEFQFKAGGELPFSGDDIREAAGFEPEDLEDPGGEDDIDEDEEEEL